MCIHEIHRCALYVTLQNISVIKFLSFYCGDSDNRWSQGWQHPIMHIQCYQGLYSPVWHIIGYTFILSSSHLFHWSFTVSPPPKSPASLAQTSSPCVKLRQSPSHHASLVGGKEDRNRGINAEEGKCDWWRSEQEGRGWGRDRRWEEIKEKETKRKMKGFHGGKDW